MSHAIPKLQSSTALIMVLGVAGGCPSIEDPIVEMDSGLLDAKNSEAPETSMAISPMCPISYRPLTTGDRPRATMPWILKRFEPSSSQAPDASPDQVDTTESVGDETYQGNAWLRLENEKPLLEFENGSKLVWDTSNFEAPIAPPYQLKSTGDRVWVIYEKQFSWVCPFCGGHEHKKIEIRDSENGSLRFIAYQGLLDPALSEEQVQDFFGVSAVKNKKCIFHATPPGCYEFDRTQFDHVLQTSPTQSIPFATLTRIQSPKGTFEVIWSASSESNKNHIPNCYDGPAIASDSSFVISKVLPQ
jgi:hypothetical protein